MDRDIPEKRRAQELETIARVVRFLAEGQISVETLPTEEAEEGSEPRIELTRIKPSWRVYGLGTGRPMATDTDRLTITVDEFGRAVRFISPRLLLGSIPPTLRVEIADPAKLAANISTVGNHTLQDGQTVFLAAQV